MRQIFKRIISKEAQQLVDSGEGKIEGGVVRKNNGEIFQHLKFVEEQVEDYGEDIFSSIQKMQKEATEASKSILSEIGNLNNKFKNSNMIIEQLQKSTSLGNLLTGANLLVSGLNLCTTVAGFTLVLKKLKNIDCKLDGIQNGINILRDSNLIDLKNKINIEIKDAILILDRYDRFEEEFTGSDYQNIGQKINAIECCIENLIERQYYNEIRMNFESIISLYSCYLELNKLTIKKLSEVNKINTFIDKSRVIKLNNLIKEKVINQFVYKDMFMCIDKFYTEKDIEDAKILFCNLCDYNVEYIQAQNKLLLEAPKETYSTLNQIKKNFYFGKTKSYSVEEKKSDNYISIKNKQKS